MKTKTGLATIIGTALGELASTLVLMFLTAIVFRFGWNLGFVPAFGDSLKSLDVVQSFWFVVGANVLARLSKPVISSLSRQKE